MRLEDKVLTAARDSLLAYCSLINEEYEIPNHIRTIANILERVESGELKRVIITIPPRHGKSMLCSSYFPAWYMGRNPEKYVITATYGQDLSDDFGRKVRDQMSDPFYKLIFPDAGLRMDSRAASRFETSQGGTYFGVGKGGPITGRGAHLLLIDDPVKDREEADSEAMRRKLVEWYNSVAYTRLMPGGSIVVIMTRWHEDDLVGHLIANNTHENWAKIDLKAIGDDGKALWPEKYPVSVLNTIRANNEYDFSCLYQQEPLPKEGIIFKPEWLSNGFADEYAGNFMAIDPAISKKETSDETAMSCFGLGYGTPSVYHELETPHGRWGFEETINIAVGLHKKWKFELVGVETVAYQAVLGEELLRRGLPVVALKADTDKVRRAMAISHLFSQGRVRVNSPDLKRQLLSFRGGTEKNDLADAAIHCVKMMWDYSSEANLKKEDRYKGLDPRSKQFWKSHDESLGYLSSDPQKDFMKTFGY